MLKQSALKDDVTLQPHQRRVQEDSLAGPQKKLLIMGLGAGKGLASIAGSEAYGQPYTAVVPASLRNTYKNEQKRFTDLKLPSEVLSMTNIARGARPKYPDSLVVDEAGRLSNPGSAATAGIAEAARTAKQVLLLTGTPMTNRPGDLAPLVNAVADTDYTPESFERRHLGYRKTYPSLLRRVMMWPSGKEPYVKNREELSSKLEGHVDYHQTAKPPAETTYEDVPVEMSPEQIAVHQAMWDKLPWGVRWKLKNDVDVSPDDLKRLLPFLAGPRQAGLSIHPYSKSRGPHYAFNRSSKLKEALTRLQTRLAEPDSKALVFSNFIGAGLQPYSAALTRERIPHALFHGGLTDEARKKVIDDYNSGRIRVALIGPSGTEGLSFKGTRLIQLLDPHWTPSRGKQSVGRGLRFDSHEHLPVDLRKVHVERYLSRLPKTSIDKMLTAVGFDRESKTYGTDDHVARVAAAKEQRINKFMELLQEVGERGHSNER